MNQLARIALKQPSLPELCPVTEAVRTLSYAGAEERGAIFTRREVVEFILDLAGYTTDRPLYELRLLEPSFGEGDFLLPVIDRLMAAWKEAGRPAPLQSLAKSVCGVELHHATFEATRERVSSHLQSHGLDVATSHLLADKWLVYGDFLLSDLGGTFDIVVGNPPYVRQELIPDVLMAEYRLRYKTIYDRADIYVPFIERSLNALVKGGKVAFICADRWMKNRYGGPLRQLVASKFRLNVYVDMVDTPAFHSDVIAYPAITVISRDRSGPTRIAHRPIVDSGNLSNLARILTATEAPNEFDAVKEIHGVAVGAEPWILESSDQLSLVRKLEKTLPTLEEAGCKVGIGVATGADKAFIAQFDKLDVESDRKLPLVMTKDIIKGSVEWCGLGVINPFSEEGGLVNLDDYPRLKRYLESHKSSIAKRHVAQKMPANWYRTIDRIYPELTKRKKLLIPDIKGEAHIVYEEGKLYPHHNLYFITSDTWDLRALQAVLQSGIARLFVSVYSTKMRGGYLRFQAQYLRRIRVPRWANVPAQIRKDLISAATRGDLEACNRAAFKLYGLNHEERSALGGNGE